MTNYQSEKETGSRGESHRKQARGSLRQALARYSQLRREESKSNSAEIQALLQAKLDILKSNLDKLDEGVIRIAAFGLVSRGKSAVLNALLGEKVLQTGPINGVTQWPRSVRWTPKTLAWFQTEQIAGKMPVPSMAIDLIDTPGLDEVAGEARGEMARQVTRFADLILFVVSGDVTQTEYDALCELSSSQKPLILAFNKIDLYTDKEREEIYQNLRSLYKGKRGGGDAETPRRPDTEGEEKNPNLPTSPTRTTLPTPPNPVKVVMVAAEPAPVPVRVEWEDGKVTHEWETPPPQIEELRDKLLEIVVREGPSLLALNALVQAREAEISLANKTIQLRKNQSDDLIWQYAVYKAVAVAFNPVAALDVLGATVVDLVLIRSLARLYNLPMTGYEAGKLWKAIMSSAGGLLLGELGHLLLLGVGKLDFTSYLGVAATQAGIAAYGTYIVGRAARVYLERGCTWGPLGQDRVIREIVESVDTDTVVNA